MKITMYSTPWCADCHLAKRYFYENNIPYEDINIDKSPESAKLVEQINNGNRSVPTIIIERDGGQEILVEPTWDELEAVV
jgi:mycoredoxin